MRAMIVEWLRLLEDSVQLVREILSQDAVALRAEVDLARMQRDEARRERDAAKRELEESVTTFVWDLKDILIVASARNEETARAIVRDRFSRGPSYETLPEDFDTTRSVGTSGMVAWRWS